MATTLHTTVVGAFETRPQAQRAVNELLRSGFGEDQIGVVGPHGESRAVATAENGDGDETYAGEGAAAGAAAGAGLGALWGMAIIAGVMPPLGPALAGGTLAAILSSAAAGAVSAGLAGTLIGLGIPKEEAEFYEGELRSGRTIVSVTAPGHQEEAMAILRRHGAYDMSSRHVGTVR